MAALRKGLRSLKQYYEGLSFPEPALTLNHSLIFPYPTTYSSPDSPHGKITFRYLSMPDPTKLVFFGIAGTDEICIKYVKDHYPVDVHQACTSLGCAPVLLACEKLAGNWLMVVMSALSNYSMLYHCRGRNHLPRSLFVDMSKQLKNFHSAGFVHGDIRDTNIMVSPDRKKFMIIDFDWAGKTWSRAIST